jgi:hypothetical protein
MRAFRAGFFGCLGVWLAASAILWLGITMSSCIHP